MMKNKYKVLIITCWILLILAVIAKLFGADWFIAQTDNQRFMDICNYIQNSFWYYIVSIIVNVTTSSIYYMAVLKEEKLTIKSLKWLIPLIIYAVIKSIFHTNHTLFVILDIVLMIGLPILIAPKRFIWILLGFGLVTAFQFISVLLKRDNYNVFGDIVLVSLIISIDYYIMLILYWLYSINMNLKFKEKGVN